MGTHVDEAAYIVMLEKMGQFVQRSAAMADGVNACAAGGMRLHHPNLRLVGQRHAATIDPRLQPVARW